MKLYNLILVLFALLLWVLTVFVRLPDALELPAQPDEIHWQKRSNLALQRVREKNYHLIAQHMGHPGVSTALVFAAGQSFAEKYNKKNNYSPFDSEYIDHLEASRIANIVVSSAIIPAIFLFCAVIFGSGVAFHVALFLLIDPHLFGLSRLAHIDSILSLYTVLTLMFYYYGVTRGSAKSVLTGGFFWGLAIATKPTAIALLPAFICFKLLAVSFCPKKESIPNIFYRAVSWLDVWAFIIGQLVLLSLFTRLWPEVSEFTKRLVPDSPLGQAIGDFGRSLAPFSFEITAVCAIIFLCFLVLPKSGYLAFVNHFFGVSALVVGLIAFHPPLLDNLVRFWSWVFGLKSEIHKGYIDINPPPWGYLNILYNRLPETIAIGLPLSLLLFFRLGTGYQKRSNANERTLWIIFAASVSFFWCFLLGMSAKQTMRYALPIVPVLITTSVLAYWSLGLYFGKKLKLSSPKRGAHFLLLFVFFAQCALILPWREQPLVYYNKLGAGLKTMVDNAVPIPTVGLYNAFDFILSNSSLDDIKISSFADPDVIKWNFKRYKRKKHISYAAVTNNNYSGEADFIIDTTSLINWKSNNPPNPFEGLQPLMATTFRSIQLLKLFMVPYSYYQESSSKDLSKVTTPSGQRIQLSVEDKSAMNQQLSDVSETGILAKVDKHPKGFILSGSFLRVHPGSYQSTYYLAARGPIPDTSDPGKVALILELGSKCKRIVKQGELTAEFKEFDVSCEVSKRAKLQHRIYWRGNRDLLVGGILSRNYS